MLVFRIICAVLVAWAMNYAINRPEAADMLREIPQLQTFVPLAGAVVGYFNLAVRQGWGVIVAVANGIWAGMLSLFVASALYTIAECVRASNENEIRDFDTFMIVFRITIEPLIEFVNLPMIIVALGATAVVGVLTEFLHWVLVRYRARNETGKKKTDQQKNA